MHVTPASKTPQIVQVIVRYVATRARYVYIVLNIYQNKKNVEYLNCENR